MPTFDPEDMKHLAYSCIRGVVGYSQFYSKSWLKRAPSEAARHEAILNKITDLCSQVDDELNELFK